MSAFDRRHYRISTRSPALYMPALYEGKERRPRDSARPGVRVRPLRRGATFFQCRCSLRSLCQLTTKRQAESAPRGISPNDEINLGFRCEPFVGLHIITTGGLGVRVPPTRTARNLPDTTRRARGLVGRVARRSGRLPKPGGRDDVNVTAFVLGEVCGRLPRSSKHRDLSPGFRPCFSQTS